MILKVKLIVETPRVPNFLRTADGEAVPICAVSDAGLRELAAHWTRDLLARAKAQHLQKYGRPRPADEGTTP